MTILINNQLHYYNMDKINIDLKKLNLNKVRDDVNLILYNSGFGGMSEMKEANKIIERLKNVKLQININ